MRHRDRKALYRGVATGQILMLLTVLGPALFNAVEGRGALQTQPAKPISVIRPYNIVDENEQTVLPAEKKTKKDGGDATVNSAQTSTLPKARSFGSIDTCPTQPAVFASTPSWQQNFATMPNGGIDRSVWKFDIGNDEIGGSTGWGNDEAQYYTDRSQNVRIENGRLIIEAHKESYQGFPYTSARIKTLGSFDPKYGRIEVTAKLPVGVGTWPAIWLLPTDYRYGSNTPAAWNSPMGWLWDGEIDLMEFVGAEPGNIYAYAHSIAYNTETSNERGGFVHIPSASSAWHTYGLDWTTDKLSFKVDGQTFFVMNKRCSDWRTWPFDQRFHLILNLAMGGEWGGYRKADYPPLGIDNSSGPSWRYEIKSIKYYPLIAP